MRRLLRTLSRSALVGVLLGSTAACEGGRATPVGPPFTGGSTRRGAETIAAVGCGACHLIPGIRGARGVVGPPLRGFARRSFIAGQFPNTTTNLERWLADPPALEPKTAMPALGLDASQTRDIAAYLYTLD